MPHFKNLNALAARDRALDEFNDLANMARRCGSRDLADWYAPRPNASLQEIEDATEDLRRAYSARQGFNPYVRPTD